MKIDLSNNLQEKYKQQKSTKFNIENQPKLQTFGFSPKPLNQPLEMNVGAKALNYLETNLAWGAVLIDLFSMVLPRTYIDFRRGTDAGIETARREGTGTVNHSLIGVYGSLAGLLLSTGINNKFGIKANKLFADDLTMDKFAEIWKKTSDKDKDFVNNILKSYDEGITTKDNSVIAEIGKDFRILVNSNEPNKEVKARLRKNLIKYFGKENEIVLKNGEQSFNYSVDTIFDNILNISKTFKTDKVNLNLDEFLSKIKKMNLRRSGIGIAIGTLVGASAQPLNMYLTKKKTGRNDFVGGGEEDKSTKFKVKKVIVGLLSGAAILASIGKFKDLPKNIQFQGVTPTINQFKFIYGMTIVSRFFASRNDNELRESIIKDSLGFANWLIIGNFVKKGVAKLLDSTLIDAKTKKLATREEVLLNSKFDDALKKTKLRKLSIAQLAGYIYSIAALGVGVPKLNIFITNKIEEAKKNKQEGQQIKMQPDINNLKQPKLVA